MDERVLLRLCKLAARGRRTPGRLDAREVARVGRLYGCEVELVEFARTKGWIG